MASQIREWSGINTFAPATQTKLFELLGKLKQEDVNTLTILVMGKGGVGKSSTVNSIIGERAVSISPFQSEGTRPVMVSRSRAGFTLNVIDTPGLIEGGYINDVALDNIKRFIYALYASYFSVSLLLIASYYTCYLHLYLCLVYSLILLVFLFLVVGNVCFCSFLLNKTIDVLLYVDRLDAYRVDNLDREVVKAITGSFGKGIWNKALVVLTHAQLAPPDGLPYDEFFSKRSEALLKAVRLGAGLKKADVQGSAIPVVLVENSGRCNKNEADEKVLPNGIAWIPHLVQVITDIALNGSKSIFVDKALIEGPNPNDRGKLLIPLILVIQYFFAIKPIERAIRNDIAKESRPSWELRDSDKFSRKF